MIKVEERNNYIIISFIKGNDPVLWEAIKRKILEFVNDNFGRIASKT